MTGTPTTRLFYHGFAQVNVPANGNSLTYTDPYLGSENMGVLNDPTLLQLNVGTGCWIMQRQNSRFLRGLAGAVELHYTSTLSDADQSSSIISYDDGTTAYSMGAFLNTLGPDELRRDLLDVTIGLHAELTGNWLARVGGSFPLRDDLTFDAEVTAQVERRF